MSEKCENCVLHGIWNKPKYFWTDTVNRWIYSNHSTLLTPCVKCTQALEWMYNNETCYGSVDGKQLDKNSLIEYVYNDLYLTHEISADEIIEFLPYDLYIPFKEYVVSNL